MKKLSRLKVVIISDTHNAHRTLNLPDGDILIHCGDWTNFGRLEHTVDFNDWLGSLNYTHKFVVNGNHECSAPWNSQTKEFLTNASFLCQEKYSVPVSEFCPVHIYGTQFSWPMKAERNPFYDDIPNDVTILISHGPAAGYVDSGKGCETLLQRCCELNKQGKLCLVLSGHIHMAHGVLQGTGSLEGVTFVNASICGHQRKAVHPPILVEIEFNSQKEKWTVLSWLDPVSKNTDLKDDTVSISKKDVGLKKYRTALDNIATKENETGINCILL